MRPYRVEFTDDANREFTELSYILKRRVNRMLPQLRSDPFAEDAIELDNNPGWFRRYLGRRYRLVFTHEPNSNLILIRRIRPRRTAYDGLNPMTRPRR